MAVRILTRRATTVPPTIVHSTLAAREGASARLGASVRPPLGTITDLSATALVESVRLDWTAAANATSQQPQYSSDGSTWTNFGSALSGSADGVTVTGLTADVEYTFRVIASDGSTQTDSNTDTATPTAGGNDPLFETNFDSLSLGNFGSHGGSGFNFSGTGDARVTVSDIVSRSGSRSVRFRWNFGHGSNTVELNFSHPDSQETWAEYYMYFPSGSEGLGLNRWEHRNTGGSSYNHKFYTFWADSYTSEPGGSFQTWPESNGEDDYVNVTCTRGDMDGDSDLWRYPPHSPPGSINRGGMVASNADRGRWVRIRVYIRIADQGEANGIFRMWKDDALLVQVTNWPSYDEAGVNSFLRNGYLMGAANGGFAVDTSAFLDDWKFWTSDPEWS